MSDAPLGLGGDRSPGASLALRFMKGQGMRLQSLFNVKIMARIKAASSLRLPAAWRACDAVEKLERHPGIFPAHLGSWSDVSSMGWRVGVGTRHLLVPASLLGARVAFALSQGQSRGILCLLESRVADALSPERPQPHAVPWQAASVPAWPHPSWSRGFAGRDPRPRSCWSSPPRAGPPPREKER